MADLSLLHTMKAWQLHQATLMAGKLLLTLNSLSPGPLFLFIQIPPQGCLGFHMALQVWSKSKDSKGQEAKANCLLKSWSENHHLFTFTMYRWSRSHRTYLDAREGNRPPLLDGRNLKEFVLSSTCHKLFIHLNIVQVLS